MNEDERSRLLRYMAKVRVDDFRKDELEDYERLLEALLTDVRRGSVRAPFQVRDLPTA